MFFCHYLQAKALGFLYKAEIVRYARSEKKATRRYCSERQSMIRRSDFLGWAPFLLGCAKAIENILRL